MSFDIARRLSVYAGVLAVVLLYVAVTTTAPDAAASAVERGGQTASWTARLGTAAAAIAIWMAVDSLFLRFWRGGDWMIFYLVRVLIGWGALLALGAMLSAGHQRLLAAVIVFAVTAAFVALWIGALARQKARASH